MDYKGIQCAVESWNMSGAQVTASFDLSPVSAMFQSELERQLVQGGLSISPSSSETRVIVRGRFVRIDEGNRFLRYLFTFFAGQAVVEVEGGLVMDGRQLAQLQATAEQRVGLFGGNSKDLLAQAAKSCAQKVAKQLFSALKNS